MRILTLEQIPPELAGPWGSLVWSDNDAPLDLQRLRKAKSLGVPIADYGGVVAVDGKEVLAQVVVEHHRLTSPRGDEPVVGVADVVTRPDALGRGLSTQLFREVHERESKAGYRLAMLWTRRTWGAHRLYEKLGYTDVYSPPTAVLPPPRGARPRTSGEFSLRRATRTDFDALESLFAKATRRRYGFVRRFPDSFRSRVALGWRSAREYHLLFRGSRPVGYFYAMESRRHLGVYEGVVTDPSFLTPLLDSIQRYAGRRWLTMGNTTLVSDSAELLSQRGFVLARESHSTLMARCLRGSPSRRIADLRRLIRDPRFSCHRGDMF